MARIVTTREQLHEAGRAIYDSGFTAVIEMRWATYNGLLRMPEHRVTMADGDLPGWGCYVYLQPDFVWLAPLFGDDIHG